ncbi:hypothetical protein JYU34_011460 [Plutella xylostella]|uniref:Uncharacterized protein n=1 Tax=Plutella xylostella TaxID=51655 RepID=A0ABQ7QH07_PLUXY|nr:uncharacterized protein LOC105390466 [Plutella xylostella]KAG7304511.1 hypothetical protein JYU34_011460 [Plutella xylostella]
MAGLSEFEALEEEVKELLENYKYKKPTAYEPCTLKNINECLIGLREEFDLFNINYTFNPYLDIEDGTLSPEALVKLVNSVWTLLQYHKNSTQKAERLSEENHILDHNNKQLNAAISRLKEKVSLEKNESRACVASAQRISDQSDEVLVALTETRAKLTQITKQKNTMEKSLKNEISRLKRDNEKLQDKLRCKAGTYTPCTDMCDSTLTQVKERERKQRQVISKLQENNQQLIREVIALKEEIILSGLTDYKPHGKK